MGKNNFHWNMGKPCGMMKSFFLVLIFGISIPCLYSQGTITYNLEPGIEELEKAYIAAWKKVGKTDGFRVQLVAVSGVNSKSTAQVTYDEFSAFFPDIPAYMSYSEPNFRVRVGNFRNKFEAYSFLSFIKLMYPGAFIVKDKIGY